MTEPPREVAQGGGRLDRVTVALTRTGPVVIPWDSRDWLLGQMAHLPSMQPTVQAFRSVGASWPVELDRQGKGDVITVIEHAASQELRGFDDLPEGIAALRHALRDDMTTD